jgi:hypothetical protein
VAVADFRPSVLFIPGILGIWAAAWRGSWKGLIVWSMVAIAGRQEAAYLITACGGALLFVPWGSSRKVHGLALVGIGAAWWLFFWALKPEMFFHINPAAEIAWPESPELWDNRLAFGLSFLLSAWWIGLRYPAALLAALPVFWGMLSTGREWHSLQGPGVHHHAFWLPFVFAAGIAGARAIPRGAGPLVLLVGSTLAFPWISPQRGNQGLEQLAMQIPDNAKVAADYDSIHRLSGRRVLWNIEQLYMPDRPHHWEAVWPITEEHVDWIIMPAEHRLASRLGTWKVVDAIDTHLLLRR